LISDLAAGNTRKLQVSSGKLQVAGSVATCYLHLAACTLLLATCLVALAGSSVAARAPYSQERPAADRTVWDGVYTQAQSARGREAYAYSCATCHLPTLEGDQSRDVPALAGDEFVEEWNQKPVSDLFDLIRKNMPKDSAGSLRAETYADLVAYILEANEFPGGAQELPADPARLRQIRIVRTPPSTGAKQ